jgi:hypothetical protein
MNKPVTILARLSLTADQLDAIDLAAASHRVTRDDFLTRLIIARVPIVETSTIANAPPADVIPLRPISKSIGFEPVGEVAERLMSHLRGRE